MRPRFSDFDHVKAQAKKRLETGEGNLERWWVQKYELPPNHELFVSRTRGDLLIEMYEDMMQKRDELREKIGDRHIDPDELMAQINALNKVLGDEVEVHDPLFDQWERDIAAGRTPDLDAEV